MSRAYDTVLMLSRVDRPRMEFVPTMVHADRRVEVAGRQRWTHQLRAPGLSIQLVDNVDVEVETEPLFDALPGVFDWSHSVTVVLDGTYESAHAGVIGADRVCHEHRNEWLEAWRGPRQRFVVVRWDGDVNGSVSSGDERLGTAAKAAWEAIADDLAIGAPDVAATIERVRRAMAPLGIEPPWPTTPVPSAVLRIEGALDYLRTHLHEAPQWMDVEARIGLGARQLRRALAAHRDWLPSGGLRQTLSFDRLLHAHILLANGESGARVARALGYRSDRAMYTALRRAGLGRGR